MQPITYVTLEGYDYMAMAPMQPGDLPVPDKPDETFHFNREAFAWEKDPAKLQAQDLIPFNGIYETLTNRIRVPSSLGFDIEGDEQAARDLADLLVWMEATGTAETEFRDADNMNHLLTHEQIEALRLEVIEYKLNLFRQKWQDEPADAVTSQSLMQEEEGN